MGICPSCGSFIDPGEPYCPECGYIEDSSDERDYSQFDDDELEYALNERGYDLDDLEDGVIDEDELEEILDDL